jgi:long-chain acyl-CoA synthetase
MLLHDLFQDTAARVPDKVALVCGAERYTYADLARAVDRLAAALQRCGVQKGDRVAIFLENGFEAVVSIYAALRAGAVFMPINSQTKTDKLGYMLNDASASSLVAHRRLAPAFMPTLTNDGQLGTCFVVDAETASPREIGVAMFDFDEVVREEASVCEPREAGVIDQDLASLIYTSGSTGEPKGVMLSHRNMVTACASVSTYLQLIEDDVILCALPLSFDYGLYQVLMAFKLGATVVLERSFTFPVKVLERMERERVTVFPGVPTMFSLLFSLGNLQRYDLSALRAVTNTAAALPVEYIRRIREAFPQARLYSMYGLTECKRVSYLPPEQLDLRPTSVGRGMPNQEWWLVGEDGERLPNGATGELVVRGSHVMRGYWRKPAATAERLKPGPLPGEQVLYTGDIFRTDSDGYLYFVSRKDDIIKSRGEKVSPKEIENVLYSLEGVREVAVIGVPDAILGEAIKAFVALQPGYSYTEKEVIGHCQQKLENFMVPKFVEFPVELPKTNTGKIRKTGLR